MMASAGMVLVLDRISQMIRIQAIKIVKRASSTEWMVAGFLTCGISMSSVAKARKITMSAETMIPMMSPLFGYAVFAVCWDCRSFREMADAIMNPKANINEYRPGMRNVLNPGSW